MKNTLFVALAVMLAGCAPSEPIDAGTHAAREAYVKYQMSFHKHASGLCFAVMTYDRSMSITNIPCQSGDTTFVK